MLWHLLQGPKVSGPSVSVAPKHAPLLTQTPLHASLQLPKVMVQVGMGEGMAGAGLGVCRQGCSLLIKG